MRRGLYRMRIGVQCSFQECFDFKSGVINGKRRRTRQNLMQTICIGNGVKVVKVYNSLRGRTERTRWWNMRCNNNKCK